MEFDTLFRSLFSLNFLFYDAQARQTNTQGYAEEMQEL
jgi:hypothetical protein